MEKLGLLATLEARPGKEAEVEAFLKSAQPLVLEEPATVNWYAFKTGPDTFGIFDTFADEAARDAQRIQEEVRKQAERVDYSNQQIENQPLPRIEL